MVFIKNNLDGFNIIIGNQVQAVKGINVQNSKKSQCYGQIHKRKYSYQ
jgi:hypothetical protein